MGLCHKVLSLTWWNLSGSEWKLRGRNWYLCLISVITCYYDANLQFKIQDMGKKKGQKRDFKAVFGAKKY